MGDMPTDEQVAEQEAAIEAAAATAEAVGGAAAGAAVRAAARSAAQSTASNVLNAAYELREIVVAQGVEFNNTDMRASDQMPAGLQTFFPDMTISGTNAEYTSRKQKVRFKIKVVNTKEDFKKALETDGIHVVYAGHARYGRGPCFGTNSGKGDQWENGSDTKTGIHRMGYPVILVELEDMDHHGYSFYPVAGDVTIQRSWCHPEVGPSSLRRIPTSDIPDAVRNKIADSPAAASYWGKKRGSRVHELLLWADWENTKTKPYDLGATNLKCKCFAHLGCSTFLHNWKIIRERKAWKRTETDRFAYFTKRSVSGPLELDWIRAWFEYPRENAFQSWYKSLQWAVQKVNGRLAARGAYWRII